MVYILISSNNPSRYGVNSCKAHMEKHGKQGLCWSLKLRHYTLTIIAIIRYSWLSENRLKTCLCFCFLEMHIFEHTFLTLKNKYIIFIFLNLCLCILGTRLINHICNFLFHSFYIKYRKIVGLGFLWPIWKFAVREFL